MMNAETSPNYLQLELKGDSLNPNAIGAKVVLRLENGEFQYQEQQISRGYMSSVDPILYFGLGTVKRLNAIEVLWPNGAYTKIEKPEINKRHLVIQTEAEKATVVNFPFIEQERDLPYKEVAAQYKINYFHEEKNVQDFLNSDFYPTSYLKTDLVSPWETSMVMGMKILLLEVLLYILLESICKTKRAHLSPNLYFIKKKTNVMK